MCGLFQKQEKGGRVKGARGHRKPHIQEIAGTGYVAATPLLLERFQQSSDIKFGKGGGKINK